jgi:hypothetical protein
VSVVLVAGAIATLAVNAGSSHRHLPPEWDLILPLGVLAAALGALLLLRRPDQRVGWVVAALGTTLLLQSAVDAYGFCSVFAQRLPADAYVYSVARLPSLALVPLLSAMLLLFPTGSLPSPRWRWLGVALGIVTLATVPGEVGAAPSTTDLPQLANPWQLHSAVIKTIDSIGLGAAIPVLLLCAASVVVRWRGGTDVVRRQIKALLAAAALWPPVIVTLLVTPSRFSDSVWGASLFALPVAAMIVAVGVAVLRYRLYDIDRVISRTLSYALVTGLLVATYIGCVALTTRALPFASSIGVAASTLVVAAAFNPLRRRVQSGVDHRFNRARYDAARTIDRFALRLRDEVDPDSVRHDLLATAVASMQPELVSLWVSP